ncbi:N-acetyllactosaminide beta-1,3-N-acetylglucosaminyltransferase 3-like [Anabas testudineus]|uniref:Hexosyltransferase n=1 Tax=Anabas testudineus TaxID=64144 RepID=A0A7N6A3J9_ANATE|nr:N-acetyllactosaminide beta-1,3-N-acetylglucosaminyltransferase 3-like [Anabas testudineus]
MFRVSRRKFLKGKRFMLAGAFVLMVVYLSKHLIGFEHHFQPVDVSKVTSQVEPPIKTSSYIFSWPRCQQNISAANMTDFSSFPDRMKDFLYYRHCRHFPMLLDLPDKCGGPGKSADVFLLLVIKSPPVNYDRREVLRKTWAKERLENGVWIRRLFILGMMDSGYEKERLNKLLEMEQREYNDILQWDFNESFYNLTLKQILFLEWMERNCPNARFLLNGDDDVFANTDNMVLYLQSFEVNDGSKHLFIGNLNINMEPIRTPGSKYFVPVQLHESDVFPPYCSGGGFLLSGYTALVIYNMSQSITLLPIDDAYMGMCLGKAGLHPSSHIGVKAAGLDISSNRIDTHDPCLYKDLLLVHKFPPSHMYLLWQRIHDPSLTCDYKKKL